MSKTDDGASASPDQPVAAAPDEAALTSLCESLSCLPGVDAAAVMQIVGGPGAAPPTFTWTGTAALTDAGELQQALAAGPSQQAVDTGGTVSAASSDAIRDSWPGLHPVAGRNGVQSVLVVPLLVGERCWGTLTLLSTAAGRPPANSVTVATAFAHSTISNLEMAAERETWHTALDLMESRSLHDQLTGLPNRGLLHELTFHALAAAQRRRSPVAVLIVDLDDFTAVNDTRGRTTGDAVLQKIALRLRAAVRGGDHVGRLGGDQFLVVAHDLPRSPGELAGVTSALAERVRTVITEPIMVGGPAVSITASIGIALTTDRPSVADLIHRADMAMFEAKAQGPGGTIIHADPAPADQQLQQQTELRLFEAFRRTEFEVYYQPVYSSDMTLVAVEALLRWNHPTDGVISAAEFIDTAVAIGLIVPLGQWVIRQALQQLRRWRDVAPNTAPQLVWCNLGPLELVAPDLTDVISTSLRELHLLPRDLGIEVLESYLDDPRLTASVATLRAAGHPLALDDFGTGYSSLSRLVDLPVSHLKVDRSLVTDLPDGQRSRTLVSAVMTIASNLNVTVISEGIETSAQAEYLAAAGSHLFQGYHFGRPMAARRITDLLGAPARGRKALAAAASAGRAPDQPPGAATVSGVTRSDGHWSPTDAPLFQQLPTAYLVMSPDLVIVDANAAYEGLLGHSRADLVGRPVFEVFPPAPDTLDEHGRDPVQRSFERARDTGRPDMMPLQQYDVVPPGTGVLTQRFWSLISAPILDSAGATTLIVQRVEDVTNWVRTTSAGSPADGDDRVEVVEAELFVRLQQLQLARNAEATALTALQASEARARAVLDTAADGILTITPAGIVQSMNPAAELMFGYPARDVLGRNVAMLMPEPDSRRHDDYLERYHRTSERHVIGIGREVVGRRADGSTFPIELAISEVAVGNPFYTGVLRDISQRKHLEEQLAHQSTHDPLTGLANRTLLMDRLQHAVARLARHPGFLAVFFIDLDQFKPVNDTHGHAVGDELLAQVACRLRRVVRGEDLVARWGGDEFVVLCEELGETWEAGVVAGRIRTAIAEPVELSAAVIHPSASVGFVVDDGSRTSDQLLAAADDAMYRNKSQHRLVP